MISDNIKRLRENAGLSQSALARKLGVTRASVNAWEMELSAPTAQYLVALAQLFHTTTDDILGLESEEQIVLRDMNEQEKRLDGSGFGEGERGPGAICYGDKAIQNFLDTNGMSYIVRAHEPTQKGINISKSGRVITIFSTSRVGERGRGEA